MACSELDGCLNPELHSIARISQQPTAMFSTLFSPGGGKKKGLTPACLKRGTSLLTHYYSSSAMQSAQDGAGSGTGSDTARSTQPKPASHPSQEPGDSFTSLALVDMDSLSPSGTAPAPLTTDRGKRLANSPDNSPCKEPQAKKQLWAASANNTSSLESTPPLASIPITDNPVSEAMLKSMLLTLQKDLHRELQMSL